MASLTTKGADETIAVGQAVGSQLHAGDLVVLTGDLGAGKTTFAKGLARGLGVTQPVTSPTYTIGHRYRGRVDVSHLDLFRFRDVSSAEWGDLEPYFDDAVVFVEWPEAGRGVLPPARVEVRLDLGDDSSRLVTIEGDVDPGLRHGD